MIKRWVLGVVISFYLIMALIACFVYILDPYFHFHKPYEGISYSLGNYVYQNDGIAMNFDYDAVIIGTSMVEHFSTEELNELFGVESVRLTFLGEGFRRINDCLNNAFNKNNNIKLVIRSIDPIWFVCDENFLEYGSYEDYPTYLYNDDLVSAYKYIYNWDIIKNDCIPELIRTINKVSHENFDDFEKNVSGGLDLVKSNYKRRKKEYKELDEVETQIMMDNLRKNIEINVLSTIKDNPDTKFILFFPPYSLVFWDELMQMGDETVLRRYMFEEYVIEELLKYQNVELYSFLDCYDITTNLDNYIDDLHYIPQYNSYILECFRNNTRRLTEDNYKQYIEDSKDFYMNYDYDSVFAGWEE